MLFRSESIRRQRTRPSLIPIPDADLERLAAASETDREQQFDDHRLMMLLRASLDAKGREMLEYRLLEFDWTAIATAVGYSNAHSAEVQFRKKLDQALARMQAHHGVRIGKPRRPAIDDKLRMLPPPAALIIGIALRVQ